MTTTPTPIPGPAENATRAFAEAAASVPRAMLGTCPACGWRTVVVVGVPGRLSCVNTDCPDPTAAAWILEDAPDVTYAPRLALRVLRHFGEALRMAATTPDDRRVLDDLVRSAELERERPR